jgi:hypothetical protein
MGKRIIVAAGMLLVLFLIWHFAFRQEQCTITIWSGADCGTYHIQVQLRDCLDEVRSRKAGFSGGENAG